MQSVSAIGVNDQDWVFHVDDNYQLLLSRQINEDPEFDRCVIELDGYPVAVDQNTPIAATSWHTGERIEIRVFCIINGYLQELITDDSRSRWTRGELSVSTDSNAISLAAHVANGNLKVFLDTGKTIVYYRDIGRSDNVDPSWKHGEIRHD